MLSDHERITYEVHPDGGRFKDYQGENESTIGYQTHFSGHGWGIFVCSADGKLYVHSHEVNVFHHSTFLAGGSVAAAGEIVIDDGQIKMISCKTGHYRSGPDEMARLVQLIPAIPSEAMIMTKWGPPRIVYTVGDFRAKGNSATPLLSQEYTIRMPGWCNGKGFRDVLNYLPKSTSAEPRNLQDYDRSKL